MKTTIKDVKKESKLCKIGIHKFERLFVPYADQPFEHDDTCVVEGYHTLACEGCGIERNIKVAGLLGNTPFIRKHEKNYSKLTYTQQSFVYHAMYSSKFESSIRYLEKEKGTSYIQRIGLAKMFFFLPVYWFSPKK